jgi:hypothetical protein
MKSACVALGSVMLVVGAVMIISISNLVPQINTSLGQISSRILSASPQQTSLLMSIGQKLTPIFALGGAVCLGYGIHANR